MPCRDEDPLPPYVVFPLSYVVGLESIHPRMLLARPRRESSFPPIYAKSVRAVEVQSSSRLCAEQARWKAYSHFVREEDDFCQVFLLHQKKRIFVAPWLEYSFWDGSFAMILPEEQIGTEEVEEQSHKQAHFPSIGDESSVSSVSSVRVHQRGWHTSAQDAARFNRPSNGAMLGLGDYACRCIQGQVWV
jgi:hypothetical protein